MKNKLSKEVVIALLIGFAAIGVEIVALNMISSMNLVLVMLVSFLITGLPSMVLLRYYKRFDLSAWLAVGNSGGMLTLLLVMLLLNPGGSFGYDTVYFLVMNWMGSALPCFAVRIFDRKKSFSNFGEFFKIISIIFGIVYIFALAIALFLKDGGYGFRGVNLIPLKTIIPYATGTVRANRGTMVINLLANIMLFVPLGFYVGIFELKGKILYKVGILIAVPVVVEIMQFITAKGISDIDDIILNFIGGLLGMLIHLALERVYRLVHKDGEERMLAF